MNTYTVQCGFADYYANTVTVTANSLEEALETAITKANAEPSWRPIDHCGDTFIDAIAKGDETDPWGPAALPVPHAFTEAALHAPSTPYPPPSLKQPC